MSKKTKKQQIRAAKKEAEARRQTRLNLLKRTAVAFAAVILVAVGTFLVGYAVRMARIHVYVAPGVPEALTKFLDVPGVRVVETTGSDIDAIVGPVGFGNGATPVAADPYVLIVDPRAGITVDPTDSLAAIFADLAAIAANPMAARIGPSAGEDAGGEESAGPRVPLVVAGDDGMDFAAFVLYVAAETLEPSTFAELRELLATAGSAGNGPADQAAGAAGDGTGNQAAGAGPNGAGADEQFLELLEPVVARIQALETSGVLAADWTDLDAAGLADALRRTAEVGAAESAGSGEGGGGAEGTRGDRGVGGTNAGAPIVAFARRSALTRLDWDEGFFLRVVRPPAGEGRLRYRLFAELIAVTPGGGPRAADAGEIAGLLRSNQAQSSVETETVYSPVVLEGDPINREHRDVVRALTQAEEVVAVDGNLAENALLLNLHRLLR